ncbi:MAG: MBL fold metallo-hydrolase [Flavobacteriaceae bacterium]
MTVRKSASTGPSSPDVWGVHDADTGSIQYVAACPATRKAAIIDPVQDFDPAAARRGWSNAERLLEIVDAEKLDVEWVLDTHPHADHLTASFHLAEKLGAKTAIGEKVRDVAGLWRGYYGVGFDPAAHYGRLLKEGDTVSFGDLEAGVWLSPGHTLASITYLIGDAAFVHDTLMQPDSGTSRADFPGGSAEVLWESIQRILSLPDDTRLFVGHDYPGKKRPEARWEASVAEHKASNIHLAGTSRADYVALRTGRDATLPLPDRMLAALQFNLRGGRPPEPDADGHRRILIPLDRF